MTVALVRPEILYAWNGPSLLIVNTRGECGPDQSLSGFYLREARFLRTLVLEIDGQRPWLCEATTNDPTSLTLTFVHPEISQPGGGGTGQAGDEEGKDSHGLPERSLDIRLTYRVGIADLAAVLHVTNRARQALQFEVAWRLAADFADIQEAQSGRREQEAPVDVSTRGTRRIHIPSRSTAASHSRHMRSTVESGWRPRIHAIESRATAAAGFDPACRSRAPRFSASR